MVSLPRSWLEAMPLFGWQWSIPGFAQVGIIGQESSHPHPFQNKLLFTSSFVIYNSYTLWRGHWRSRDPYCGLYGYLKFTSSTRQSDPEELISAGRPQPIGKLAEPRHSFSSCWAVRWLRCSSWYREWMEAFPRSLLLPVFMTNLESLIQVSIREVRLPSGSLSVDSHSTSSQNG